MNLIAKCINNYKGISTIYTAIVMFVLVFMVGIGVDVGFMYVTKGQLHNAADAGALAGAGKLKSYDPTTINAAKLEAKNFAECNKAGECLLTGGVSLNTSKNELDTDNDITVGYWNGTTYTPTLTNPNAVQVRTRRTADSPLGQVNIYFSKLFGWDRMSAVAQAISGQVAVLATPIAFCINACDIYPGTFDPANPGTTKRFYFAPYPSELTPAEEGTYGIAWTVFSETSPSTPTKDLIELICGKEVTACNKTVYSDNGAKNTVMRQLRCAFKDPNFDRNNKVFYTTGPNAGQVRYWSTTVPVFEAGGCPPGDQPLPYRIVRYAKVAISEVYASGNQPCNCTANVPSMAGPMDNAIDVVHIQCIACDGSETGLNMRPTLVQ